MACLSTLIFPYISPLSCWATSISPNIQSNCVPKSPQCGHVVGSPQIEQFPSLKIEDRGLVIHRSSGATCTQYIPNHYVIRLFYYTTSVWVLTKLYFSLHNHSFNPIAQTSDSWPLHTLRQVMLLHYLCIFRFYNFYSTAASHKLLLYFICPFPLFM
jgi:hypothetical protein